MEWFLGTGPVASRVRELGVSDQAQLPDVGVSVQVERVVCSKPEESGADQRQAGGRDRTIRALRNAVTSCEREQLAGVVFVRRRR